MHSEKIFSILSRGSVKDNSTGLIWTRCSLSDDDKPIYDFNCKGERKKFTWTEGVQACENLVHEGRSDWRLPNVKELQSIVFYHHYSVGYENISQVVEGVFPNVVSTDDAAAITACRQRQLDVDPDLYSCTNTEIQYWSSTIHTSDNRYAWFIDFFNGNTSFAWRTTIYEKKTFVRCVTGP